MGMIKVKLYENTPLHSENFLKLVKEKHYDSLLFHRVVKDFMIQGGASDSRCATKGAMVGVSDLGYTIEAEIRQEHHHIKGALAAARQGDDVNPEKKSSGEQFYIVQGKIYQDEELEQIEQRKLFMAKN
ncbi:MAG: peptidylprolyl isomerase [Odoribacter sp.]